MPIALPADEVEFAAAAGGAEIAGNDDVAELAQVEVRRFLPALPGLLVLREYFGTTGAFNKPIESLERNFGEETGHADHRSV
jgi:hypothetical protein